MANLAPTQFVVIKGQLKTEYNAAVNLADGDIAYKTAANTYDKANNVTALEAGSNGLVMVIGAATTGNPVTALHANGEIDLGTSIGVATNEIIVSGTDGKMAPTADLASADFYTRVGFMSTTDRLKFEPRVSGVAKA